MLRTAHGIAALALVAAACAPLPPQPPAHIELADVTPFSAAAPGAALPGGWQRWTLARFKKPTSYDLIHKDGRTVVEARADGSASALLHPLDRLDPRRYRALSWRWKTESLVRDQDNTRSATEDAPLRLVVRFDGDRSKLDFSERMFAAQVKAVTGQELPYATLMYIWARAQPREKVIVSRHTERIRMIVVETGSDGLGAWQQVRRNLYEDFRRAYGEEPGPITGIGIMTDTDNTGGSARSWYGDIALDAPRGR
ncbi:MAG: DUF3047 domain-containing protein [Burkholderiales bacterium]|nr:DUF3047 domain-containing protein [Burkholderiales bacterium]